MPNKSNQKPAESDAQFIEDIARLLQPWGVPQTAARLYGYLLLRAEPVSLDQMTTDLQVSKSSASVAARLLEQYMLARRLGERGSKRVLYEASDDYDNMMSAQNRLLQALADVLRAGERIAGSKRARDRLGGMAAFYLTMREAMDTTARQWRARRRDVVTATGRSPAPALPKSRV
jgi:predicted DNA-binding transcriptional regulator